MEKGFSLSQIVVGVVIALVLGSVVSVYVIGYIQDARLASELREVEEVKLRLLGGEEVRYESAEIGDLKEDVRDVLGYHVNKGTNVNDVVFKDKVIESDGKVYVGELSMSVKEMGGEKVDLQNYSVKKLSWDKELFVLESEGDLKEEVVKGESNMWAGTFHSLYKTGSGKVFGWGQNSKGQVGDGTIQDRHVPVEVNIGEVSVREIKGGAYHSFLISGEGDLYSWGRNDYGQLGLGTVKDESTPQKIEGISNVKDVHGGQYFSVAVTEDGEVFTWGRDEHGQLGNGSSGSSSVVNPVKVEGLVDIVDVSAGLGHVLALDSSGDVYVWGKNSSSELGDGTLSGRSTPFKLNRIDNIKKISSGYHHNLVMTDENEVFVWGKNNNGQLGIGTYKDKNRPTLLNGLGEVSQVDGGLYHSIVLLDDGSVYTWGYNGHGQVGLGADVREINPHLVNNLEGIVEISAGHHNLAKDKDGTLYAWGYNGYGQLGNGSGSSGEYVPLEVDLPKDLIKENSYSKITPEMTSNTEPYGKVESSSHMVYQGVDYGPWRAFSDSEPYLSEYKTFSGWLSYEFEESEVVNKYEIYPQSGSGDEGLRRAPSEWVFEAWDGIDWVELDRQEMITDWELNMSKSFEIDNSTGYKKYRLNVFKHNGSDKFLAYDKFVMYEED